MSSTLSEADITYRNLLIRYLKPQWKRALPMTFLLLVGIGLQLVNPQLLRYFIDTASAGKPNLEPLLFAGALFIVLALISQGSTVLTTYLRKYDLQ
ncbi:MAG TPA: hypothetical protein VFN35_28635 [Ktedonobacteraceae bacterium]|nr:hypothetical protein [Ktedonobacteraceae bacterium]